jgi:hypothetical protein
MLKRYGEYKNINYDLFPRVPAHWEVLYLSQVAEGQFISNKKFHNQNLLLLSYGNIINKDINTMEWLLPASFNTCQIENGIVLLNEYRTRLISDVITGKVNDQNIRGSNHAPEIFFLNDELEHGILEEENLNDR